MKCKFKDEDFDYECDEITDLESELCIFHDENYLNNPQNKDANEQSERRLIDKIKNSNIDGKP